MPLPASHARFGVAFTVSGLAIAVSLLALNLCTFPVPPAEAGWVDVGPLVGLWYLAVTIRMWSSLPWIDRGGHPPGGRDTSPA